jgi:hypothetical protein
MIEKPLRNYLAVAILLAATLMGIRGAWQETVKIGCLPVNGTNPPGTWMDGCASDQIGSFGLDVLWYNLDPAAVAGIDRAKVLFFGDSRILTAISDSTASAWFAVRHIPMYLLAFGAGEQSGFADRLGEESIPAQAIANDPAGEEKSALGTKSFLDNAATWCRYLPWLCGRTQHFYRQYLDGVVAHQSQDRVWFNKNQSGAYPITTPGPQDTADYPTYLANAQALIAKLQTNPQCVVFTIVPNSEMDDTLPKYLAAHLGARVVPPRIDGLFTIDHYHLTQAGAETWTQAFLTELQPIVQQCVGGKLARNTNQR